MKTALELLSEAKAHQRVADRLSKKIAELRKAREEALREVQRLMVEATSANETTSPATQSPLPGGA